MLKIRIPLVIYLIAGFLFYNVLYKYSARGISFNWYPWDVGWYASIVDRGYFVTKDYLKQCNVAFFPLYPVLVYLFKLLTNLPTNYAMQITSGCYTFLSVCLLYRVIREYYPDYIAGMSTLLFILNPHSMFLFSGYSESLYFLCTMAFFYLLTVRKSYVGAALAIGIGSAVRHTSILLIAVLGCQMVYDYIKTYGLKFELKKFRPLFVLPLCFLGLACYIGFLYIEFSDPLAFFNAQKAWYGSNMPGLFDFNKFFHLENPVREVLYRFADPGYMNEVYSMRPDGVGIASLQLFFLLFAIVFCSWFLPLPFGVFLFVVPVFYLFATHQHPLGMASMGRYLVVVFPGSLVLVLLMDKIRLFLLAICDKVFSKNNDRKVISHFLVQSLFYATFFFIIYLHGKVFQFLTSTFYRGGWVS